MKKYSGYLAGLKTVFLLVALVYISLARLPAGNQSLLPYRFLLVISNQWNDPASYLIEGSGEFQTIVTLLKNWGLPFDILRLDQQNFDRYHLFDREGLPRYSTIIWDADPAGLEGKDLSLLSSLVQEHAVSLVVIGDAVSPPEVADLAGIKYISEYRLNYGLSFIGEHFITRALRERQDEFLTEIDFYAYGNKVALTKATAIVTRGHLPFLTVREFEEAGRVVWLGTHRAKSQINIQIMRDLLKRCLVWTNGYALYNEYKNSILLFMDDFGTSDRTYLPYWHYRTLHEEDIRLGIIKPLKKNGAVLNLNIVSGYVDRKTQKIVSPWKQKVIDEIDGKTIHDYISAKRGLDEALGEGVIEIQSHGYTHMLPDLESPPGPFWTAPMDGEGTLGFDYEFGDPVRNKEIPAITQKFLLARGLEYIKKDFGVTPLFVINGGHAWSRSYPNNSPRIAAQMGFGLSHFNSPGYLGRDLVISSMEPVVLRSSWQYDEKLTGNDIPWSIDAPYFLIFHDRDISMDVKALDRLLTNLGDDTRYMSASEYCGYLHAQVVKSEGTDQSLCLTVDYDHHYCQYFDSHESKWTVHLSDGVRSKFDDVIPEKRTIIIPNGVGRHIVCVGADL
jgi:hypothetical protein